MKTLTKDQIEAVMEWMNTWEQLRNTAIPIRFKEDFTKQLYETSIRKSSPLVEGKTKSNIKVNFQNGRQAPPPPPIK